MVNFKDLETKGFVVIKDFLSAHQIEIIKQDYLEKEKSFFLTGSKNKNYKLLGSKANFEEWVNPLIDSISENTNLIINCVMPGSAYFNNQLINFLWHQDHECYYQWQEMHNAINCWIPIIKPDPNQSGIKIVPHDIWINQAPDIFKKYILGQGAKHFVKLENGTTNMHDDSTGDIINLPFNLDDVAITPELKTGDALILRQDIIHQTQDNLDNRVAISIRCRNKYSILTKSKLVKSCARKNMMIAQNKKWYDDFIKKFKDVDQLMIKDFI